MLSLYSMLLWFENFASYATKPMRVWPKCNPGLIAKPKRVGLFVILAYPDGPRLGSDGCRQFALNIWTSMFTLHCSLGWAYLRCSFDRTCVLCDARLYNNARSDELCSSEPMLPRMLYSFWRAMLVTCKPCYCSFRRANLVTTCLPQRECSLWKSKARFDDQCSSYEHCCSPDLAIFY